MFKFNASIVVAAAALFVSTGALAAAMQPAAGEAPYFDQPTTQIASTLTRHAVEMQAEAFRPAAGQNDPMPPQATDPTDTLTRAQVESAAANHAPAAGQND